MPLELNCQEQEYYPVVVIQLISLTPVASLDYQTILRPKLSGSNVLRGSPA